MMRKSQFITLCVLSVIGLATSAMALKGVPATEDDMKRLKKDVLAGKIKIGATRLLDIQNEYGEAPNIIDDDQRVTYDYGDLRVAFDRERYWKSWEKDTFRRPVYTDDVDDLRFDLESGELVGDNITFSMIRRSYGEPTESEETDSDGGWSVYYYGDIKLVFENVISVKSWRGANLGETAKDESISSSDVFKSSSALTPAETAEVVEPIETAGSVETPAE